MEFPFPGLTYKKVKMLSLPRAQKTAFTKNKEFLVFYQPKTGIIDSSSHEQQYKKAGFIYFPCSINYFLLINY